MNIGFYISGKGTRLRKFLEKLDEFDKYIKLVVSDDYNTVYLRNFFNKRGIKYIYVNFESLDSDKKKRNEIFSNLLLEHLKKENIDYCISFGKHLLKGILLKEYKNKLINIHPAILPSYKGLRAIDQALEDKAFVIGSTAHLIDEGIDTGEIIMNIIQNIRSFDDNGYDGILDNQIILLENLLKVIVEKRLVIIGNKVTIKNADYLKSYIFPKIF